MDSFTKKLLHDKKKIKVLWVTNIISLLALGLVLYKNNENEQIRTQVHQLELLKENSISISKEQMKNSLDLSRDTIYCIPIVIK